MGYISERDAEVLQKGVIHGRGEGGALWSGMNESILQGADWEASETRGMDLDRLDAISIRSDAARVTHTSIAAA